MGADHTAGLAMDQANPVKNSQETQLITALCDSSGFCQFQQPTIEDMRAAYNYMLGSKLSFEDMADLGWQCMQDEWEFNRRVGFGPEDNDLPEWMRTEPVPSNGAVFAVTKEDMMKVFERMPISDELRMMKAVGWWLKVAEVSLSVSCSLPRFLGYALELSFQLGESRGGSFQRPGLRSPAASRTAWPWRSEVGLLP
jgi:hypothetical protein